MSEHRFYTDNLLTYLRDAGIPTDQIWELDGWQENEADYFWTDVDTDRHDGYNGRASGHLFHHTATTGYTPNVKNSQGQTKANVWAGMRRGNRLYQDGPGVPTLAIASAGPANYSAGSGVRQYVKDLSNGIRRGRQTQPDDTPTFWGNRYTWNTEIVCDGVGGQVTDEVWQLLAAYGAALSKLHNNIQFFNGFHAGFTKRKIDYRDGRYPDAEQTMNALWADITRHLNNQPTPPPEEDLVQLGRQIQYVKEGDAGLEVEYWQVMCIIAIEQIPFTGNSNKTFITTHAPQLTFKVWDQAMTDYLSAWTRRHSYGVGPTERIMIERAVDMFYNPQ